MLGEDEYGCLSYVRREEPMKSNKSILDGMKTKEQGFPLGGTVSNAVANNEAPLVIVGHCPTCGNPIYGKSVMRCPSEFPVTMRSCHCAEIQSK